MNLVNTGFGDLCNFFCRLKLGSLWIILWWSELTIFRIFECGRYTNLGQLWSKTKVKNAIWGRAMCFISVSSENFTLLSPDSQNSEYQVFYSVETGFNPQRPMFERSPAQRTSISVTLCAKIGKWQSSPVSPIICLPTCSSNFARILNFGV